MIFRSFRVGISKNKNIDQRVKGACAIMSIQVTYETDHICSLIQQCQVQQIFVYVFYDNIKEKDRIRRNINSKKELFICNLM